ncbi:MAG TPA: alpha/beta hydrolase [Acidimicrobiales bacterium]|nr:alpha/beta hydrolase [Acidimicrobiales bacterium]
MTEPAADAARPAVLMLHGQPGEAADWEPVTRLLVPDERVIVPDRPGYGANAAPAVGPVGNADFAARLLESEGAAPAVVVGHSYGATVALALAEVHPASVAGLVLVCPVGTRSALGVLDHVLALSGVGSVVAFAGLRGLGRIAGWAGRRVEDLRFDRLGQALGVPSDRLGAQARAWGNGTVWRSFAGEQRYLVAEMGRVEDALPTIGVPVRVLAGRRDPIVRPPMVAALTARLPDARVRWVADAGHLLPWQAPAAVVEEIGALLAGLGPGEPAGAGSQ